MQRTAASDASVSSDGRTQPLILANYPRFESRDIEQTQELVARTYFPHQLSVPRRGERLEARLNHRPLAQIGIGAIAYGAEIVVSKLQDQDFSLLLLPLAGQANIAMKSGEIGGNPELASVVSPRTLNGMRWSSDCQLLAIEISAAVLEKHITLMTGRLPTTQIYFTPEMPLGGDVTTWWDYADLLLREITASGPFAGQHTVANLETLLILKLLESHPSNYSDDLKPQSCKIAPAHVRKVERYIVDHVATPITLEQLVEVSGVSARALFDGFRRFRGQSPMAYLRAIRFDRVRHDLLNAQPGDTVTSIACRWEFYQFGRFAGQYRKLFGELPSDTLRYRL